MEFLDITISTHETIFSGLNGVGIFVLANKTYILGSLLSLWLRLSSFLISFISNLK